jgi:hypothetical protein
MLQGLAEISVQEPEDAESGDPEQQGTDQLHRPDDPEAQAPLLFDSSHCRFSKGPWIIPKKDDRGNQTPHKACRKPTDVASANRSGVISVTRRVRSSFGFLEGLVAG